MKLPTYFKAYGGLATLLRSRYFWGATVMTVVCSRYFVTARWWDAAILVVPGLFGFSIAGVAIFVSLGSDSLRAKIAGQEKGGTRDSPFMAFMAIFTHFIVVQLCALILAIVAKALFEAKPLPANPLLPLATVLKEPFWLLGGLCFSYAIFLCVALAHEIYRLASMIDAMQTAEDKPPPDA